jgi:HEAT repeat protein
MVQGGKATIPLLAEAYAQETDASVRDYIIDAIALSKDRRALPVLTQALADPSHSVRETAAEAAATCGGRPAAGVLIDALAREQNRRVRESFVRALGMLDTHKSRTALQQALQDPDEAVRKAVAEALAASGAPKEST